MAGPADFWSRVPALYFTALLKNIKKIKIKMERYDRLVRRAARIWQRVADEEAQRRHVMGRPQLWLSYQPSTVMWAHALYHPTAVIFHQLSRKKKISYLLAYSRIFFWTRIIRLDSWDDDEGV